MTASFLKELLRRSALLAADASAGGPLVVSAAQLDAALDELLDTRHAMTRTLLGGTRSPNPDLPGRGSYPVRPGPSTRVMPSGYDD